MSKIRLAILLTVVISCLFMVSEVISIGLSVYQDPSIKILVQKETLNDKVRYRYKIVNNSREEIVIVNIGFDFANYKVELRIRPIGHEIGSGDISKGSQSPRGWKCSLVTQEETSVHYIEWEIIKPDRKGIMPKQSKDGFAVDLPQADSTYETGHFEIILRNTVRVTGLLTSIGSPNR
jgi:hypothetical protein